MNKIDFVLVKLNGKNYLGWSFHLENCVEGPGLAGYLDGFVLAPSAVKYKASTMAAEATSVKDAIDATITEEKSVTNCKQNNAKVVT